MTKRIVLCADDYGQAESVSKGILALLTAGRLTATSCLVNQPDWQQQAAWLTPHTQSADVGLHLNFTEGTPVSTLYIERMGQTFMPLGSLLRRSLMRSRIMDRESIAAEINAQLDLFEMGVGSLPRFIDGHQHVHHLPVISDVLLEVYQQRLQESGVYLRAVTQHRRPFDVLVSGLKRSVIHYTGGSGFAGRLDELQIPHNTSFEGIYTFNKASQYRDYFQNFLRKSADRGLIMCHPGLPSNDPMDPIGYSRSIEYDYLNSPEFTADCERFGISLSRFQPE